jgi:hypothetical protein
MTTERVDQPTLNHAVMADESVTYTSHDLPAAASKKHAARKSSGSGATKPADPLPPVERKK